MKKRHRLIGLAGTEGAVGPAERRDQAAHRQRGRKTGENDQMPAGSHIAVHEQRGTAVTPSVEGVTDALTVSD